jgi:hypothetical protein
MKKIKDSFDELIYYIKEFVRLKLRISILKITDKIAEIAGELVANIIVAIFILFGLFLSSIALALLIGQIYNNLALGFCIVGILYLIVGIIIKYLYTNKIKRAIADAVVKDIFKE